MSKRPYPGLRAFRREEIDIFFGREQQIDEILEKLQHSHFLAVIGPSGCGKSSLVRTGVLSALDSGFMASAGARWVVADMHPGHQPFVYLAEALLHDPIFAASYRGQFPADWGDDWQMQALPFLQASLQRGPLGMQELLAQLQLENTSILLLVDQFEEVFRYQRYASNEAGAFVRLLLSASQHPAVYTIITMRSDFLGHCSGFQGLPEAINQGLYLTPRLGRDQMADAIALPARVFGGEVEPELVNTLLNEAGQAMDQLPLLQHLLMRLWDTDTDKHLTLKEYQELGGLAHILDKHLEEAWAELSPAQQEQAGQIFRLLTERTREGQDIRRPVKVQDLMQVTGLPFADIEVLLEVFRRAGRNFLMPPPYQPLNADTVVDITHESLIRQWKRLRQWVESEAEKADLYHRLADTAQRYRQGKAALLVSPDLDIALKWRDRQAPTEVWSRRYGHDFQGVMDFLVASEQERVRERQQEVAEYQEKVRLKYRRPLQAFAVGFAFFLVAALVGWWFYLQLRDTMAAKDEAQREMAAAVLAQASTFASTDNFMAARQLLDKTGQWGDLLSREQQVQANLFGQYTHLRSPEPLQRYLDAGVALHAAALTPDAQSLLVVGEKRVVGVYDLGAAGQAPHLFPAVHGRHVQDIVVHPQGKHFVTTGDDGVLLVWALAADVRQSKPVQAMQVAGAMKALAFSPDGRFLASGGTDNRVSLWEFDATSLSAPLAVAPAMRSAKYPMQVSEGGLAFTPDSNHLAAAFHDGAVRFWEMAAYTEETSRALVHEGIALGLAFSPDGQRLAVAHGTGASVWDWQAKRKQALLDGAHKQMVFSVAWVDGSMGGLPHLVTASGDHALYVWDVENRLALQKLEGHTAEVGVAGLAYDPKQRHLYSPGKDGQVLAWQMGSPNLVTLPTPGEKPQDVAVSAGQQWIAVGSDSPTQIGSRLQVYATDGFVAKANLWLDNLKVTRVLFHPSEPLLAVAVDGKNATMRMGNVLLYRMNAGGELERVASWEGHASSIEDLVFSKAGDYLLSAGKDGQVGVYPVGAPTGAAAFFQLHEPGALFSVDISADGAYVVSSDSRVARFYAFAEGELGEQAAELALPEETYRIRISPPDANGISRLLAVGRRAKGFLWELGSGGLPVADAKPVVLNHATLATHAGFLPNANLAVTSDANAILYFWDMGRKAEEQVSPLFSLRLPAHGGIPLPFRYFALNCTEKQCLLGVPLAEEQGTVIYRLGLP